MACEGETTKLTCNQPFLVRIVSAVFGRTQGAAICPHDSIQSTNCTYPNSTATASVTERTCAT
ncbi:hypothetical protein DPMN_114054 [Dreissena polymorpha]|uniref:SUEL-type lectin domain-containing protein n=1 Tax=Dreissena polymorpha TaxID=45954 RepID=A0A9D4QS36_DREPO|nr:hypothetical protein DPMN_114054 [Dreissena polymorpha]